MRKNFEKAAGKSDTKKRHEKVTRKSATKKRHEKATRKSDTNKRHENVELVFLMENLGLRKIPGSSS